VAPGFGRDEVVPKWEEYLHTPGVFVRMANKGLAGYGTWKSVWKMGGMGEEWEIWGCPLPIFL
jgi:hypothetical protein